ncbi:hypothetical protein GCM10010401_08740 [Rarobacter faecitabidus]|uniref:Type IV secretory system conjugative DNA transfer VirD4/TraG family protein n=1 Tax=Rarobacter faecitabidus TaxID=13243 RepID=A0A542ZAX4_RARFA|nr:TraM recognition domain-containing protein [Rarobacter faecitabidus]TQL57475.1 type IV secretory system conjugative DNA transfer VirD4/TraG family protein [Rarobacter faecitabidus]
MKYIGKELWLPIAAIAVFAASAILVFAGKFATFISCGQWPRESEQNLFSGFLYIAHLQDAAGAFGKAGTCTTTTAPAYITMGILVVLVITIAVTIYTRWRNWRLSPAWFRKDLLSRKEIAAGREVDKTVGTKITKIRGQQVRPSLRTRRELTAPDVAWLLGHSHRVKVWLCLEDAVLLIGPPRSGKGFTILTSAIVEAPGAVVTTSTRGDNMEATILARSQVGPVYLFDPEGVTGRETTIRWSPVRGCEDGAIAKKRASVLITGTGLSPTGNNAEWAGKAADILQCLLHAAAVGQVPLTELHEWTKSPAAARRAVTILETKSNLHWAPMLAAVLDEEPRSLANKWFGVSSALSALDVPEVRAVFEVGPGEQQFDPEVFLLSSGTLYLVAEPRSAVGGVSGVGVFFSMLLDDIRATAHKIAMRSPGGRLDPPAAFILDEIANLHPWAGLPEAMAAGSGEGLQCVAVFQSRNQIRDGYGSEAAGTIWEAATRKLLLGSASDTDDLRNLSDLLGIREERISTQSWSASSDTNHSEQVRERPVLSVEELRRLPEGNALLVAGRARPILVDLIPHPERPWAEHITASKKWHQSHPAHSLAPGQRAATFSQGARP